MGYMDAAELKQINEEQKKEIRDLQEKLSKMEKLSTEIIYTLSNAIDAKDSYTSGHSRRVAEYTWKLSKKLGKSKEEQRKNYYVGLLHDIGKIGVPDVILNKPGRLTDDEFAVIKDHPAMGEEILVTITLIDDITVGARWHHERYDGTGYPDRLKGEEIPELARIISVADAYDAMTSTRSYRGVLPQEVVRREIENGKGTQFDPVIADKMLELIDEDVNYEMHE